MRGAIRRTVMNVTIFHNPRCSKSNQTLKLLRDRGIEPDIIEYLSAPPSAEQLKEILDLLAMPPRDLMRKRESPFNDLGLADASLDRNILVQAMADNPILIQRPIVLSNGKAAIGRPPENILNIL